MSTPYVGLKRVFQSPFSSSQDTPWRPAPQDALPVSAEHYREEVKKRLIHLLTDVFGVTSLQVGAFQMKLTDAAPERHLFKATHYLIEQYQAEQGFEDYAQPVQALQEYLTACLRKEGPER